MIDFSLSRVNIGAIGLERIIEGCSGCGLDDISRTLSFGFLNEMLRRCKVYARIILSMPIIELANHQQFLSLLAKPELIIIDFKAEWCGLSTSIAGFYEELSKTHPTVTFASVDVDKNHESAAFAAITAMPTFHFYRHGKLVHELKGADKQALQTIVEQLASTVITSSSTSPSSAVAGQVDLHQFISNQIECLNFDSNHQVGNIFTSDATVLQSDSDEQLIITIGFNQPVKIHSLKFIAPANGPKKIKTYVNRVSTLDFDDAEQESSIDSITLTPTDLGKDSTPVALRFVKYQYVHQLTVLIVLTLDLYRR